LQAKNKKRIKLVKKDTTYPLIGASNHTEKIRDKNDYYATNPEDVQIFLNKLSDDRIRLNRSIWEPACGAGHISRVLEKNGFLVQSTDLIDRGYGDKLNYLTCPIKKWGGDIITNPPFKLSSEFIEKSISILNDKSKLLLLLPIRYLETKIRYYLFKRFMPKYIYVYSYRIKIGKAGNFAGDNAVAYCWLIWEKGYQGDPQIRFIANPKWS